MTAQATRCAAKGPDLGVSARVVGSDAAVPSPGDDAPPHCHDRTDRNFGVLFLRIDDPYALAS
jgi:hypothetical protein